MFSFQREQRIMFGISRSVVALLSLAVLISAPGTVHADLKQTKVVCAWNDTNAKFPNSNVSDPFDGGREPFVTQIDFYTDLFDIAPYGSWVGQQTTTTQWADPMDYSIRAADNTPMGYAGYQHMRYWSLVNCDRTSDGDFKIFPPFWVIRRFS